MSRKIIDYVLVSGDSPMRIQEEVMSKVKNGYEPHGAVTVHAFPSENGALFLFFQWVIKYEEVSKKLEIADGVFCCRCQKTVGENHVCDRCG